MSERGPHADMRLRKHQEDYIGLQMAFIDWTSKFSVGSPVLDQQHKALIELINQLHAAMLRGGSNEDLQRIFQELIRYTQYHFKAEEGIMRQAGYPRLEPHYLQHVEFVEKARELHSQLLAGKFTVSMDLLRFLKSWLSDHILGADRQYVPFLKAQNSLVATRA
jgi:hemerythrin-like metal-binding protein